LYHLSVPPGEADRHTAPLTGDNATGSALRSPRAIRVPCRPRHADPSFLPRAV